MQQPHLGMVASYLTTDDAALVAQLVGPIIEGTFAKGEFVMAPQVPVHVIHALKINNRLMETWGLATVIADGGAVTSSLCSRECAPHHRHQT